MEEAHAVSPGQTDSDRPRAAADPGEASIEFPVSFDLRVIYILEEGSSIVEDLEAIYRRLEVPCALIQCLSRPGSRYGRMGSRLSFAGREQLHATYEAIGKLPYVKAAL